MAANSCTEMETVSPVSSRIVRIRTYLAPGKAMGSAQATHRPVWRYRYSLLGVDTDTVIHSDETVWCAICKSQVLQDCAENRSPRFQQPFDACNSLITG